MIASVFSRRAPRIEWFKIDFGRDLALDDVRRLALGILSNNHLGRVVFEAVARQGAVTYRVGSTAPQMILKTIESTLPGTIVTPTSRTHSHVGTAGVLRISTRRRPIRTDDPEGTAVRILTAIGATQKATVIHQVVVGRRLRPNVVPAKLKHLSAETWPAALIEAAAFGPSPANGESRRALMAKESLPGANVTIRVLSSATNSRLTMSAFEAACRSVEGPGVRLRLRRESWSAAIST